MTINISGIQSLTSGVEKSGSIDIQKQDSKSNASFKEGSSFQDHLLNSLNEVNSLQKVADQSASNLSTGKSETIHETMLALTQAELSFNLLVQVRNKALEAYQEVMRMPV